MSERGVELKVGILVTVCVALLVVFIVLLGGTSGSGGEVLYLDVDTSAALKTGSPVKIAGVAAGSVLAVDYRGGEVDPATGKPVFVRVTLGIDGDKLATLHPGARFYITSQGILGEKYVEIEPAGSLEGPPLAPGAVVEGEPPLRLEIMALNANRVLTTLAEVLRKNEGHIDSLIVDASETMAVVRRAAVRVDDMLARDTGKVGVAIDELLAIEAEVKTVAQKVNAILGDGTAIQSAIANVSGLSAELRRAVPPVVGDVRAALAKYGALADLGAGLVKDARGSALGVLESAEEAMGDVKGMIARVARGEGSIGAFLKDNELYDDVREMMKDLKRHPWKFIWKE